MDVFLGQLYSNRFGLAVLGILLVVVGAGLAGRRGWHRSIARHPRASLAASLVVAVVATPSAWWLLSPLVIRSELVEPPPAVAPSAPAGTAESPVGLDEPGSAPALADPSPTPPPSRPASPSPALLRSLEGAFVGADDFHFARGTARVVETRPGRAVLRLEAFSVRNGPDLYVYLSPDPTGYVPGAIEVGRLKATDGSFNYELPAGLQLDGIRSVVIWCKAFSVPFGTAELRPVAEGTVHPGISPGDPSTSASG